MAQTSRHAVILSQNPRLLTFWLYRRPSDTVLTRSKPINTLHLMKSTSNSLVLRATLHSPLRLLLSPSLGFHIEIRFSGHEVNVSDLYATITSVSEWIFRSWKYHLVT